MPPDPTTPAPDNPPPTHPSQGDTPPDRPNANPIDQALYLSLPLPLSHLYSRTFTAKTARARHDNAYYLFEALIKLTACPPIAAYCRGTALTGTGAQPRNPDLDKSLLALRTPSVGHWLGLLRQTAKHFAAQPHHPLSPLHRALTTNRYADDHPAILALYRAIKNGPDAPPAKAQACSLLDLFDSLTQYRNAIFGHGAARPETFYEQRMAPLLSGAAHEVLAGNVLPILGPEGTQLLHLRQVREPSDTRRELEARELVGPASQRLPPIPLTPRHAESLTADGHPLPAVAVHWPGHAPLRLDPLVRFREYEVADDAVLLNRDRRRKHVEYLSYATGRTERDAGSAKLLNDWLARAADEDATAIDVGSPDDADDDFDDSTYAVEAGRTLGDYNLLAEIGRGGMGVVYLAEQRSLRRQVALKTLPRELHDNANLLTRFRREMRVLGSCDHPNIVKLLDSGVLDDGTVYYTMEYIAGCDLNAVWNVLAQSHAAVELTQLSTQTFNKAFQSASLNARTKFLDAAKTQAPGTAAQLEDKLPIQEQLAPPPLPPTALGKRGEDDYARRVVQLIRDAADALDTVHQRGIVHRDISPGNLMLTPDGSRVVLMDFGLAKGQDVSVQLSAEGAFAGKYRYAAPEQYAEGREPITAAVDVRGLGVTLWELLTRRRLFPQSNTPEALTHAVTRTDVPRLRSIDPHFDKDLDAIVARACERDVNDRIKTAGLLRDYLQMYLDGTPLPIRPPSLGEMAKRWAKENRGVVYASAAGLALALLLTVAAFFGITQQRNVAIASFENARTTVSQFFTNLTNSPAFFDDATAASQRGMYEDVIARFTELLDTYADRPDVQSQRVAAIAELAAVEARINNHDRVLAHTQQALDTLDDLPESDDHAPLRARLLNQRARAHLARRELQPGIDAALAALNAHPDPNPDAEKPTPDPHRAAAHLALADLYRTRIDFTAAARHYNTAREQLDQLYNPEDPDPRVLDDWVHATLALARLYRDEKRKDLARDLFIKIIDRIDTFQKTSRLTSQLLVARNTARRLLYNEGPASFGKAQLFNSMVAELQRLANQNGAPPRYATELDYARIARAQHAARYFKQFGSPPPHTHELKTTPPSLFDHTLRYIEHDLKTVIERHQKPIPGLTKTQQTILLTTALMHQGTSLCDLVAGQFQRLRYDNSDQVVSTAKTWEPVLAQHAKAAPDHIKDAIQRINALIEARDNANLPPDFGLLYQRTDIRFRLAFTLYALQSIPEPDHAVWSAAREQYALLTKEGQALINLSPNNIAARVLFADALLEAGNALHPRHDTDDRLDRLRRALDTLRPLATPYDRVGYGMYIDVAGSIAYTALEAGRPTELRNALDLLRPHLGPWLVSHADEQVGELFEDLNVPNALERLAAGDLKINLTPDERQEVADSLVFFAHYLNRYLIISAAARLAPPETPDNPTAGQDHLFRVRDTIDRLVTLWGSPDKLAPPAPEDPFRSPEPPRPTDP
ncbi:MAG: serine/threonine-protein kinase [Planctomycetota bacterium]